jgi:hypothetical protein
MVMEDLRDRVSCRTVITILLAYEPKLTTDDLRSKLDELGMTPSDVAIYSCRRSFFRNLELLREAGLLIEAEPRMTTRFTKSKGLRAK